MSRLYIYGVMGVGIVVAGAFVFGYVKGQASVEVKAAKETIIKYEERNELEKEVRRLAKPALVRRYCKWVRDSEDECLQAHLPVS